MAARNSHWFSLGRFPKRSPTLIADYHYEYYYTELGPETLLLLEWPSEPEGSPMPKVA